jgi:HSP20 family molecular chaperone IbpA
MIDRAERLHRQFFQPIAAPMPELSREPPIDIIETDSEILITVALPGVDRDAMKVPSMPMGFRSLGFRRPSNPARQPRSSSRNPHGKFERRIQAFGGGFRPTDPNLPMAA